MTISTFEVIDVDATIEGNNVVFTCPFCRYKGLARKQNKNNPLVQHKHGIHSANQVTTPHCIDINLPKTIVKGSYGFRLNVNTSDEELLEELNREIRQDVNGVCDACDSWGCEKCIF